MLTPVFEYDIAFAGQFRPFPSFGIGLTHWRSLIGDFRSFGSDELVYSWYRQHGFNLASGLGIGIQLPERLYLAPAPLSDSRSTKAGSPNRRPKRLKLPKNDAAPTMPLARDEIRAMFAVAGWAGSSKPGTVANYWRQRLAQIAEKADVQDFRTHRLRDTFAVELLLADVSIEDVSVLLGHSSVQTTERYYAPWDRSRRDRLARIVLDAHKQDPLLAELYSDPAHEPGGCCNVSSCPPPGPGGQIQLECASPWF